VLIFALAAVFVVGAMFWNVANQAHVLLITDPSLVGSTIYVDGRRVTTVRREAQSLSLRTGLRVIKVNHRLYGDYVLRYRVVDDEQGSRETLVLRRRADGLVLLVE